MKDVGLTMNVPGSPDSVVQADLVSPQQFQAFEVFPFWRHQLPTKNDKTKTDENRE